MGKPIFEYGLLNDLYDLIEEHKEMGHSLYTEGVYALDKYVQGKMEELYILLGKEINCMADMCRYLLPPEVIESSGLFTDEMMGNNTEKQPPANGSC